MITALGKDYDTVTLPTVDPYIAAASVTVDNIVACIAAKGASALSSTALELIERFIAAYNYTQMDGTYTSRSTDNASGSFNKVPEAYLNIARSMDNTGCVNACLKGYGPVGILWMGKNPDDQIPYYQRGG